MNKIVPSFLDLSRKLLQFSGFSNSDGMIGMSELSASSVFQAASKFNKAMLALNPLMWLKFNDSAGLPTNSALGFNPAWTGGQQWAPGGGFLGYIIWPLPAPDSYTDNAGHVSSIILNGALNYGILGGTNDGNKGLGFNGAGNIALGFTGANIGGAFGLADKPTSVCSWFKGGATSSGTLFSIAGALNWVGSAGFRVIGATNTLQMYSEGNNSPNNPVQRVVANLINPTLFDGGWHFVFINYTAVSNASLVADIYIDGVLISTLTCTNPGGLTMACATSTTGWSIGAYGPGLPSDIINNVDLQHFAVWEHGAGYCPDIPMSAANIASLYASSQPSYPIQPSWLPNGKLNLTFDEEFNEPAIDRDIWELGWFLGLHNDGKSAGNTSFGAQCNLDSANVSLPGDGYLHLALTNIPCTFNGNTQPYTGCLVGTRPSFSQLGGYFEARINIPDNGSGHATGWLGPWLAGFGVPFPGNGEIDILETLAGHSTTNLHYKNGLGVDQSVNYTNAVDLTGWHNFGIHWDPVANTVDVYYDGVLVFSHEFVSTTPAALLIDHMVKGDSLLPSSFPSELLVDWYRVWK